MHFTVRVLTALVCQGTESRLMIRKMTLPDNPVERANLLTGAQDIRWHRKYLALCEAVSVDPDELLAFFKSSLLPLPGDDRPAVLRQYLGKPRHPEYQRRRQSDDTIPSLFRALTVLASPQLYPPLVGHPSEVVETHLRRVLRSAQWNGLEAIAKQYGLEVVDVLEMLRMHYPGVLIKAVTEPSKLRLELEYFVTERPDMATTIEFLWQRIMELLGREWDLHSSSPPGVRRRKLALLCELSNFDALMEWAQKFAPEMNPWLHSLSQL
jgi:hypothetical protein